MSFKRNVNCRKKWTLPFMKSSRRFVPHEGMCRNFSTSATQCSLNPTGSKNNYIKDLSLLDIEITRKCNFYSNMKWYTARLDSLPYKISFFITELNNLSTIFKAILGIFGLSFIIILKINQFHKSGSVF